MPILLGSQPTGFPCPVASSHAINLPISGRIRAFGTWMPWILLARLHPAGPSARPGDSNRDDPSRSPTNPRPGLVHSPPVFHQSPPRFRLLSPIASLRWVLSTNRVPGTTFGPFVLRVGGRSQRSFPFAFPTPSSARHCGSARAPTNEARHTPPRDARVWCKRCRRRSPAQGCTRPLLDACDGHAPLVPWLPEPRTPPPPRSLRHRTCPCLP